jgi:hypothetical protein
MFVNQALNTLRVQPNELINNFFSVENINNLQKNIISRVKQLSNNTIERQCDQDLFVIMQYVYANNIKSQCGKTNDVINNLNSIVLKEVIPMVIKGVQQYVTFLHDSTTRPVPLDRGTATSIKGDNSLMLNR